MTIALALGLALMLRHIARSRREIQRLRHNVQMETARERMLRVTNASLKRQIRTLERRLGLEDDVPS